MENKQINLAVVSEIAKALAPLNREIIFVGGAVVSLYTDDPAADEIRPTTDIDVAIEIKNFHDYEILQNQLFKLNFQPDPEAVSICRYKYNSISVDIMNLEDSFIGASNSWYAKGLNNLVTIGLNNQIIKILSAPYFIASKFEAFNSRGKDYRTSYDIEDIIYIVDNRISIAKEVINSPLNLRTYIKNEFQKIIDLDLIDEILIANVHPLISTERIPIIKDKINQIIG